MGWKSDRIVWMDCEMTGLEVDKHTIVEIAVVVTDAQLNIVANGPNIVIHQDEEALSIMNDWCKKKFPKNGLLERIRASKVEMAEAEDQILTFLMDRVIEKKAPLAGNSVYNDRLFIKKFMPRVDNYLHHHHIDVDSVRLVAYRWYPQSIARMPLKTVAHRALDDINKAIEELKYYRKHVFHSTTGHNERFDLSEFNHSKLRFEKADRIVWMNCKTIELEPNEKIIVEITIITTTRNLNIRAEQLSIVIHQDEKTLSRMSDELKTRFAKNGLIDKIRDSKIGMTQAEKKVLAFLKNQVYEGKAPLAGNSIYVERLLIRKCMPRVSTYLHHHLIDVNSIMELARRWYPSVIGSAPRKRITHRAIDDIRESIEELRHYRANVFK